MDEVDRAIINGLHGGFPLCPRPYAAVARDLGIEEEDLLARVTALLSNGILTRFGPLFDAERLGGELTLCALSVPAQDFERVAQIVNALPQVAHNYERDHAYNMWFVLATRGAAATASALSLIEQQSGYPVLQLPREAEYFVELKLLA